MGQRKGGVNVDVTIVEAKEKIKKFLGRFLKINTLNDDDDFYKKGFVNSLFSMQLVMFIENEFNISIQSEDLNLNNFSSIASIMQFIEIKLKNKNEQ